jgi:rhodanese-related sulfurtransferase
MRRAFATIALSLGLLAALADSPRAQTGVSVPSPRSNAALLARRIVREEDHVTAVELAQWIRGHKKGLRILDLRSAAEFEMLHVPRAERLDIERVVAERFDPAETVVLISDGGAHAAQAWVLLESSGVTNVYFLRGGIGEWIDEILSPAKPTELTRYFGGMRRREGDVVDAKAIRRRGC